MLVRMGIHYCAIPEKDTFFVCTVDTPFVMGKTTAKWVIHPSATYEKTDTISTCPICGISFVKEEGN